MAKIVYVVSGDPKVKTENVSAVMAQALTAVSFGYDCEIFLMDEAVWIGKKGGVQGVKFKTFEPIEEMLANFMEMEGKVYICHPSSDARDFHQEDAIEGITFVNASKLLESGKEADALFTF
ncbi:MAG: DsrE family protein [Nitrospirota bacterium]|jgi:predicted peroxiredoxin